MRSEILRRNGQEPELTHGTNSKPSEQGSAISTLADNQNAPYARLLGKFRHSSFTLTRLKRVRAVAIYQQAKSDQAPAFEVVIIRRREASFAFGKDFPATEYYPHNEDWGTYGFTYRTLEEALAKFSELALVKLAPSADGSRTIISKKRPPELRRDGRPKNNVNTAPANASQHQPREPRSSMCQKQGESTKCGSRIF